MQKDVHFYLTYALARKAGIDADKACIIAWADQHTDDLTKAELHGLQTQCAVIGNWSDRQIQRLVLVPFHFVPAYNSENPWEVKPAGIIAESLINKAIASKDLFQIGIALHALQDTFSHQGFTGWDEEFNACFPWYYIQSTIPNIGHAEMQATPDIINAIWTDPRTGELIDNKERAMHCAFCTFKNLALLNPSNKILSKPEQLQFEEVFQISNYDVRKEALLELSGEKINYSEINKKFDVLYRQQFIVAASKHLAAAIELIKDLSGPL